MSGAFVGRGNEIRRIDAFLDGVPQGGAALVLHGQAGIGKSTLWRLAIDLATQRGYRVLRAMPAEAEHGLGFATLADLLDVAFDAASHRLPPPQANALAVALLRGPTGARPPDARAIAMATTSLLRAVADSNPVVVAIDDCQWADRASSRALAFAARRVLKSPVGWLLTRRTSGAPTDPDDLETAVTEAMGGRHAIGQMNLSEVHHLLRGSLGVSFPRPTLTRIERAAAGNPLFALEIARELLRLGETKPVDGVLPIPASLGGLVTDHTRLLSPATRRVLLHAALSPSADAALLTRVFGSDRAWRGWLSEAVDAGVVALDRDERIHFSHPLFAMAVQAAATTSEVRAAHARLASTAPGLEVRAMHLARSAEGTDEAIASIVEEASRHASARGATDSAVDLMGSAVELTPPGAIEREHRQLAQGELALLVGDTQGARRVLAALGDAADPTVRASALMTLARIAWLTGSSTEAAQLGEQALASAQSTAHEAALRTDLALLGKHDRQWGLRHAQRAVALLEPLGSDGPRGLLARALAAVIDSEVDLGLPLRATLADRALALRCDDCVPHVADRVGYYVGSALWNRDRLDDGRVLLTEALDQAQREGDEGSLPRIYDQLAQLEVIAGRWAAARTLAEQQVDTGEQTGQEMERLWGLETLASIDVREGARRSPTGADEILREARATGDPMTIGFALRTVGFAALSDGELAEAIRALREVDEIADAIGLHAPSTFRHDADLVEALTQAGMQDEAEDRLDRFRRRSERAALPSGIAAAARCLASLAAARGDLELAADAASRAVVAFAALEVPFEHGRSLLTRGVVHRRRREKRLARLALEEAHSVFGQLGARAWSLRATDELRRLGIRPVRPLTLTETERRVAELAAAGLTNPQIAARLYMSRKTVEFNLAKAYRKLDVKGRAGLGMALAETAETGAPRQTTRPS